MAYRWRTGGNVGKLETEIAGLRLVVIQLRHELTNAKQAAGRLKYLVRERSERIDQLNATIGQLRAANQKLDAEAERLCEMVRLG